MTRNNIWEKLGSSFFYRGQFRLRKSALFGFFVFLLLCFFVFLPKGAIFAQEEPVIQLPVIKAVAGEDKNIVAKNQVVFSALGSVVSGVDNPEYFWDFGDGDVASGKEVAHVYYSSGVYRASLRIVGYSNSLKYESGDEVMVSVDKDVVVLISDKAVDDEKFRGVNNIASSQGILVVNINQQGEVDYVIEKELAQQVLKSKENIRQAGAVIIWTDKNFGLNAFLEAAQNLTRSSSENGGDLNSFGFQNKFFVVVTEQNFSATAKLAQSLYNLLNPQFIVLTKPAAANDVFSSSDFESLLNKLRASQVDYRLVGLHTQRDASTLKPWNFLSYCVGYMVDNGVPINTIYLILILPVIATIMAFSRQIIGVKALGIYTPSIVAVTFLVTGLKYGLALFLITLLVGTLGRLLARKIQLSYLPRMAIVLSLVSFSIFVIFLLGARFGKNGLLEMSFFPILVIVLLTEKFISVQIERGNKSAVMLILETLFLSVLCYWVASWQTLRTLILGYPEYILLTVIINLLIGKWTGLRLTEYYRFRKVIKNVELAEKK